MLQYLGLILVITSWIGGWYLVSKWHDKDLSTISRHAASNKQASWLFAFILIGLGSFFYYWLVTWFAPHLKLSFLFVPILAATILCQLLTGIVPDIVGWRRNIHRWAAYTMAVLYLPLSITVIQSTQLSLVVRTTCVLLGLYMLIAFVLVAILGKAKSKYLFFQASYIVAFQLIILAAAYLPKF